MLVLQELSEGLTLFKVPDALTDLDSVDTIIKASKLVAFRSFQDVEEALTYAASIRDKATEIPLSLKQFLAQNLGEETVIHVGDSHLANIVANDFGVRAVYDRTSDRILRALREATHLVEGTTMDSQRRMALALSHALCRYTLRCGADRVDVMIMQAVTILDDTEKEVNQYSMRLKEWYGWHWPELPQMITDPLTIARIALSCGRRENVDAAILSADPSAGGAGLSQNQAEEIVHTARTSSGFDITDNDMSRLRGFAGQLVQLCEYRASLNKFLETRMRAVAPGVSALVGELVGARLIAEAGQLLSLAKAPASTIQLLGAAKSLFRALKRNGGRTPKYGVIYHANIIQQASSTKARARLARSLSAKTALAARVDGLMAPADSSEAEARQQWIQGLTEQMTARLATLEGKPSEAAAASARGRAQFKQYQRKTVAPKPISADNDLVGIGAGKARPPVEEVPEIPRETAAEDVARDETDAAPAPEQMKPESPQKKHHKHRSKKGDDGEKEDAEKPEREHKSHKHKHHHSKE